MHTCVTLCVGGCTCVFIKKKLKKVPVYFGLWLTTAHNLLQPQEKGRKREIDKEVNEEDKDRSEYPEMIQKKLATTDFTSKGSVEFTKML